MPVRLAFFCFHREPVAVLPSAAGVIESPLPDGSWPALGARVPAALALVPHVEGILAWEAAGGPGHAYRMSIDHAFRIIGAVRARARGATTPELLRVVEAEVHTTREAR